MRRLWLGVAAVVVGAAPAGAGPILDRVKAAGVVRCGGVGRPGLATIAADGSARGLELDLCRAIAAAALGANGRLEFVRYDSDKAFAAARAGHEDVMFLTGGEMVEHGLAGDLIPGPAIFVETTSAIVRQDAPYRHLQALAGKPICFALGPHAQFHLHAWFEARHLSFIPTGFQEDVEMNDAYKVGYCAALAGETTTLAETAQSPDLAKALQRFLPETLAAYPILAASSIGDGGWAALVAWTVATLQRADAPDSAWVRGGYQSLPIEAPALGLDKGWQQRLVALTGTYRQLYEKNLGALGLPLGLNGALIDGGAFAPPYVE